jgi:hypothetical protein
MICLTNCGIPDKNKSKIEFFKYFDFVLGVSSTSHLIVRRRAVLRIRDVYPGFQIQIFPSQIPDSAAKNLSIFNPKICF